MGSPIRKRFQFATLLLATTVSLQTIAPYAPAAYADQATVIGLNNDGVKLLQAGNFSAAIQKFQQALDMDKTYKLAKDNLAIAYNNYGLQLRNNPKEALKQFHQALFLNSTNTTTQQNVEGIIRMMGKNPKDFKDRVELGDASRKEGDFVGAVIEYSAALQLKDDPKLHIKLGDVYRVKGQDQQAIVEYQAAAKSNDNAEIELKLGQAYGAAKDIPNAIQAYGRAIQFKSDDPDVLDGLVAGWNEALKENPLAPENHIGLGQALQYRGDWGGAEAEYKAAIRLSVAKRNPVAERLLGALPQAKAEAEVTKNINAGVDLQQRKLYDQAIEAYKKAQQARPNDASILINIGTAYQAKGDFTNALQYYQQAQKIDPSNQAAVQGIKTATAQLQDKTVSEDWQAGGDLFKQGKFAEAAQKYIGVLKITPQDPATHYSLGAVYQAMKQIDDAISEYKLAIQFDNKNPQYQKALNDALDVKVAPIIEAAVALHKDKNYSAAIDKYQQALAIRPNNAELWYNIASAEYSQQNYNGAKTAYLKALDIDPKGQVNDLYYLGLIAENYGQGLEAKSQYSKYLQQAPGGPNAQAAKDRLAALTKNIGDTQKIKSETELAQLKQSEDAFAQAVKAQGDKQYDQAITLYTQAIKLQPKNADFVYSLGTCYQANNDIDNAITCYLQAQSMNPSNKDYGAALSAAYEIKAAPIIDAGVAKQTSGDVAGAIADYKQGLKLIPNYARLWTNLGTAYQQLDQYADARAAYQKGLDLDAKNEVGNIYLIAVLDENSNQGNKAWNEYQDYLKKAGASGQYVAQAKGRVAVLGKNVMDVQHLQTAADAKTASEAAAAYDAGVKAQQANNYDEAIAQYQKAIGLQPKQAMFVYALGTAYQAKNEMPTAIAQYEKAVSLDPSNKDYKTTLAGVKTSVTAGVMDQAVQKQQAGDLPGAIALYEQALATDPKNATGWTNLGSAYQQSENWAKAASSYRKAIEVDPRNATDNYYYLGVLDENNGNGNGAIADYTTYIQKAPRGQYASVAQGRISALRANPTATQKITTQAVAQQNADAQNAYTEAVNLQSAGKLDEAIASYQKAIGIVKDPAYIYGLGTAYQAKNEIDKAIEQYRQAGALAPKEPVYKTTLKQALQAKAAPLVNAAIEKQVNKNDPAGAVADYRAALAVDPDDAATHMNFGTALQQLNKALEAADQYRTAIRLDPKAAADAKYYLGTVLEQLKKPADAMREYMDYIRSNPGGANIKDARERVKILQASGHR